MKADAGTKSSYKARGRGTYATQACTVCRRKKMKCDELKPVCGPCFVTGRQSECSWGKDRGRRPRTEAHFEAMRKRADALEEYVSLLESELERCRQEHRGSDVTAENGEGDGGNRGELGGLPFRRFRPDNAEGVILTEEGLPSELDEDDVVTADEQEGEEAFAHDLCSPTRSLQLEDGSVFYHGSTAPWRFAPEATPSPGPAVALTAIAPNVSRFSSSTPKYTLLLDGDVEGDVGDTEADNCRTTSKHPDHTEVNWSRYLPESTPLSRREHDKILDLVFKFFSCWCLRIVPDLFLQDMHRALSLSTSPPPEKTTHYSPMLHNAIIAVGTAFSDDPRLRQLQTRHTFAREAKGHLERECQVPNISVVHALSMLGGFHSGMGEQTLGYMYFGMSARISQALGLSIDCSAWVRSGIISEYDVFDRNWAHWTIFTQDVCWSLYVGRDFSIPASSSSSPSRIPFPFVDNQFDQQPWHYPPSGNPPQPSLLSKTFAKSCELLMSARRIMDVVNGLNNASARRKEVNDELVSDIDLKLNTWKNSLVDTGLDIDAKSRPTATPHCLLMHCTYWWFFILLHRPFYHRHNRNQRGTGREIDHIKLCKRGAENIVSLLTTWRTLYTLRYTPITIVQTAFSAGTIYILLAAQSTSGLRVAQESLRHAVGQAQLCVGYLREIGESWHCAMKIAKILESLICAQVTAVVERRAGRTRGPVLGAQMFPNSFGEEGRAGERPLQHESGRGTKRRRESPTPSEKKGNEREERSSVLLLPPVLDEEVLRVHAYEENQNLRTPGQNPTITTPNSSLSTNNLALAQQAKDESTPSLPLTTLRLGALQNQASAPMASLESKLGSSSNPLQPIRPDPPGNRAQDSGHGVDSWSMDYNPSFPEHGQTTMPFASSGDSLVLPMLSSRTDASFGKVGSSHGVGSSTWIPPLSASTSGGSSGSPDIDPSSFLAMLGGEPLSNAPFLPGSFDSYNCNPNHISSRENSSAVDTRFRLHRSNSSSPPPASSLSNRQGYDEALNNTLKTAPPHFSNFGEILAHGSGSKGLPGANLATTAPVLEMGFLEGDQDRLAILRQFWDESYANLTHVREN